MYCKGTSQFWLSCGQSDHMLGTAGPGKLHRPEAEPSWEALEELVEVGAAVASAQLEELLAELVAATESPLGELVGGLVGGLVLVAAGLVVAAEA